MARKPAPAASSPIVAMADAMRSAGFDEVVMIGVRPDGMMRVVSTPGCDVFRTLGLLAAGSHQMLQGSVEYDDGGPDNAT